MDPTIDPERTRKRIEKRRHHSAVFFVCRQRKQCDLFTKRTQRGLLARVLLLLANFGREGRPEPIVAKISQETLAEMIGTTRSRVSHFMNKFRKLGFIEYNGHLEITARF